MEQVLYPLPDGWSYTELASLCKFENGDRGKNYPSRDAFVESGIPVINAGNLDGRKIVEAGLNYITRERYDILGSGKVRQGDLLFCLRGSLGKCAIVSNLNEGAIASSLVIVRPSEALDPNYLLYFFNSSLCATFIERYNNGAAQPNLSAKSLSKFLIPLASREEQKRIVEKLDALLTRIDTAIEHLQSKLDLSKQLFDSVLDEFFKLSDCDSVPLTEVVDFIGGSQPPKSQFSDVQKEGYVRLIQIRDYKTDNHIVYVDSASTKKFCTKDDVMIGRYGPPVFQILRGLDGAYNVALMKAVPNEDVLTKDYLFWFLQSPSIQNYVIGISQRAAGQSGVNKKALEKYHIPVPSKTMQNDIVDKVGQLVNKSYDLEAEVSAEIASLSQLKASILDSAFKGEL